MDTEQQLKTAIGDVLAGNRDAFQIIVSMFQRKVLSTAYQATYDSKEAEDLAQEIFLQVFRNLSQFRFESSFSTWIYRIAIHKSMDWKRSKARRPKCEELETEGTYHVNYGMESQKSEIEEYVVSKESNAQMHRLINGLPDHYREVIQLYHFQNQTYRDIAITLQVSEKTVETRLYRAKQKLRELREKEEYA